jgi:hypothetical protein
MRSALTDRFNSRDTLRGHKMVFRHERARPDIRTIDKKPQLTGGLEAISLRPLVAQFSLHTVSQQIGEYNNDQPSADR